MADGLFGNGGAYFGNPNIARQGVRARELAQKRNAETLPDPRTYGFVQGLLGTNPNELGMSVLSPNTAPAKEAAYYGAQLGNALAIAPAVKGVIKGVQALPKGVASDIEPMLVYHRTTTPFEGDFKNVKNKLGVSFAGDRGFYFSKDIEDPTTQIFGKHIISANVDIKNPAPVYQVAFGQGDYLTPRSIIKVDAKWLKENPNATREGGITIADSIDDVVLGKSKERPNSFKEYEKQIQDAAKKGKLYALIDPEKLYDKQVKLLESKGYDGFNYVKPDTATSSMPSQVVAFKPEQIKRVAAGNAEDFKSKIENPFYKDPFGSTIK
jgi:hypothetical protein